jgi:orotidine-5'-phosphate decarboxylase
MHWGDLASQRVETFGPMVVGIDPAADQSPTVFGSDPSTFLFRCVEALLDGAQGRVGFVKFQSAFFEAFGSDGVAALARSIASARERGFAIILDAKRGDIGSTAAAYARAYLTPHATDLEVDCLTVNPFLGPETLEPFIDCSRTYGKGLFILVKTSNPGSGWLQDQRIAGSAVSDRIADLVSTLANETVGSSGVGAIGAVVGATYPSEAIRLRSLMPRSPFLAPGLGAQGGDPAAMAAMATPSGPVLISASRGVSAIEDRSIGREAYVALVKSRIDAFKAQMPVATL